MAVDDTGARIDGDSSQNRTGFSPDSQASNGTDAGVPGSVLPSRVKRLLLGAPRSFKDPTIFHKISLIAFLAWIGLGADGLSSSSYGPDEAFRALGKYSYLAVGLALATAITVFVICYTYSKIIERFPSGGGGYVVASKLLGPKFGVVSGSALLVDYVLTISVSIASGADQIFSFLPLGIGKYKMLVVLSVILILTILNLRGVKESVTTLMPIFLLFLITHVILIFGGIIFHLFEAGQVVHDVRSGFNNDLQVLGAMGLFAIFIRAYSMGAGTYTGIEAVSNGIQIMREPKVETARRTMLYMAVSLAVTAAGIIVCYLLYHVVPVGGKTMNAVLLQNFAGSWSFGSIPVGEMFVILTLVAEAALLFVAALAGFIAGPRVMANMALDSWMPHRFSSLSDRLTMQNGVILIAGMAIFTLLLTRGDTSTLVLMYSINVFLTFSLSQMGMVRYWVMNRSKYTEWRRQLTIHLLGLALCLSILIVNIYEKFMQGGWITLIITSVLIALCLRIKGHYGRVRRNLNRLDEILTDIPLTEHAAKIPIDPRAQTAVLFVNSYSGLGIHSFLTLSKLFPNHFRNIVFVSINVVDAGSLKGIEDINHSLREGESALQKYVTMAEKLGFAAAYKMGAGTEVLSEAKRLALEIAGEYPRSIFFTSKLVFEKEHWYQRLLHNETASQIQREFQFAGLNTMVLPIRVFSQ